MTKASEAIEIDIQMLGEMSERFSVELREWAKLAPMLRAPVDDAQNTFKEMIDIALEYAQEGSTPLRLCAKCGQLAGLYCLADVVFHPEKYPDKKAVLKKTRGYAESRGVDVNKLPSGLAQRLAVLDKNIKHAEKKAVKVAASGEVNKAAAAASGEVVKAAASGDVGAVGAHKSDAASASVGTAVSDRALNKELFDDSDGDDPMEMDGKEKKSGKEKKDKKLKHKEKGKDEKGKDKKDKKDKKEKEKDKTEKAHKKSKGKKD